MNMLLQLKATLIVRLLQASQRSSLENQLPKCLDSKLITTKKLALMKGSVLPVLMVVLRPRKQVKVSPLILLEQVGLARTLTCIALLQLHL